MKYGDKDLTGAQRPPGLKPAYAMPETEYWMEEKGRAASMPDCDEGCLDRGYRERGSARLEPDKVG